MRNRCTKRYNNHMDKRVAKTLVHLGILGGLLQLGELIWSIIF